MVQGASLSFAPLLLYPLHALIEFLDVFVDWRYLISRRRKSIEDFHCLVVTYWVAFPWFLKRAE